MVFATMMAGAITLSLALSESNAAAVAGISSGQTQTMPRLVALGHEALPLE